MTKTHLLLVSVAAVVFAAPGYAADKETYKSETKIEKDSKGNYESKANVSKTDMEGTTTKAEKKVDINVDSDGETKKTVTTEESTDPKGLMNKTTTKTKDTEKTHSDGTAETTHKKTVNGKTVEEEKSK